MTHEHEKPPSTGMLMVVLFLGVLMGAMDIAILSPALPSIQADLGTAERDLALLFSIYILFNLVGTPLMSKLSDLFGRRTIYLIDVALFAAGSLGVALLPTFAGILVARGVQGFGAGGIFPVASAVIGDVYPAERRGRALGLIGMVFGLAFIIGPVIAGLLLPFGWRLLFWINLPLAALVMALGFNRLPRARKESPGRFDAAGAVVLSVILAAFAYGASRVDTEVFLPSLLTPFSGGLILLALILIPVFVIVERRAESPIMDVRMFANRQIVFAGILNVISGAMEAGLVFMPLYAVAAFGASDTNASFLLLPLVAAMVVGSPLAGAALDRVGPRVVVAFGTIVMTVGLTALGFAARFGLAGYIISTMCIGIGLSALLGAPIRYILLREARPEQRSMAQGLVNIQGGVGQLLSAAVLGAVASSISEKTVAYASDFLVLAAVGAVSVVFAFLIKRRASAP